MKHLILGLTLCCITPFLTARTTNKLSESDLILTKLLEKINSINTLSYTIKRELNYPSVNYKVIQTWKSYYDFSLDNSPINFTYQFEDSVSLSIYNGTEQFYINKPKKTIELIETPKIEDFQNLPPLYNSMITLKNSLALLIKDKAATIQLRDTLIDKAHYKVLTINIGKRRLPNFENGFEIMQTNYNLIYDVIIDMKTFLPKDILQYNDSDNDFIKTSFSNFNLNPEEPSKASWFYSSYLNSYTIITSTNATEQLKVGDSAPEWNLKRFDNKGNMALNELKGQVVLIDFWIKNCGHCISSIPFINKIQDQYTSEAFQVVSINSYDTEKTIASFIENHSITYPVLLNGKQVANAYGTNVFPKFFLLDRNAKIISIYTGFSELLMAKIEMDIKDALKDSGD